MRTVTAKAHFFSMQTVFSAVLMLTLVPIWISSLFSLAQAIIQNHAFRVDEYCEKLPFRMELLEYFSTVQLLLGKHEISDFAYYKDPDGYIHYSSFYRDENTPIFTFAQRLAKLQKISEGSGTKLLFVMPPGKYDLMDYSQNSAELLNNPSDLIDEMLLYLSRLQVNTLDLSNMENAQFYKTDHHWTIDTAFEAARYLAAAIYEKFEDNLDPTNYYLNPGYYNKIGSDASMLGSMGRKTGVPFSGVDDFSVLLPKFSSSYERRVISGDEEVVMRGDIEQTLINLNYLEEDDIYKRSSYSVYLDGIREQNHIVNLSARNHRTALIIHDSYFSPVICFLAPMFWKIDTIYNLQLGKSADLASVIKNNTYDYIIFEVYPFNLSEDSFQFFKEEKGI